MQPLRDAQFRFNKIRHDQMNSVGWTIKKSDVDAYVQPVDEKCLEVIKHLYFEEIPCNR